MRFWKKIKQQLFCRHKKWHFIFRTRHYCTFPETEFHFWQDCVVGIKCEHCGKQIFTEKHLDFGKNYPEKPHFMITEIK